MTGSSPRVRGKLRVNRHHAGRRGLIPACAGKTSGFTHITCSGWAHPRVCGENFICGDMYTVADWLIPACAGKTSTVGLHRRGAWAHPRVCGENSAPRWIRYVYTGSSPRVRGKQRPKTNRLQNIGLIPACAGKTACRLSRLSRTWAHPRVCGENETVTVTVVQPRGSSPRVRGKRRMGRGLRASRRLIPACAGKTREIHVLRVHIRAHPRVCGENASLRSPLRASGGSSPRVRGKLGDRVP